MFRVQCVVHFNAFHSVNIGFNYFDFRNCFHFLLFLCHLVYCLMNFCVEYAHFLSVVLFSISNLSYVSIVVRRLSGRNLCVCVLHTF